MKGARLATTLRKRISRHILQSEIPFIVYAVIIISMIAVWNFRAYNEDLAIEFFAELFGVAFTLFIIHVLLFRAKVKRWKAVREDVDYLIARCVNRLRDGIAVRVFRFTPKIKTSTPSHDSITAVSKQRNELLQSLAAFDEQQLTSKLNKKELFTETSYEYFNEKAQELWSILNMRYSDYFHPALVSLLIDLHINLKDLCAHIRQYLNKERYPDEHEYYGSLGIHGATTTMKKILRIVNRLKQEGYSEDARAFTQRDR